MFTKDEIGKLKPWTKEPTNLSTVVDAIEESQSSALRLARCLKRRYWNFPLRADALLGDAHSNPDVISRQTDHILSDVGFNISREVGDALVARVCRTLSCKVQTVGGDGELRAQAKKLTRMVDSLNDSCKTRAILERCAIDGLSGRGFGACLVYFDPIAGELKIKRLNDMTVFFLTEDDEEQPSHMYIKQAVPREWLIDTFPRKRAEIENLPTYHEDIIDGAEPSGTLIADTVKVYKGWKLQRGEVPGHYAEVCDNGLVLRNVPYPHDCHQVVLVKLFSDYRGPGGWALGRGVEPFHRFQNDLIAKIDGAIAGAVPRIMKRAGEVVTQYGNTPFEEITFDGEKPQIDVPSPLPPVVFDWFDRLRNGAYNTHGVSQSMSAGQMPVGISSGQAIRDYAGFADDRLQSPSEKWKTPWVDVAKAFIALAAENFKDRSILISSPGSEFLDEIRWKDVDMGRNKYRVKFAIASGLVGTGPYQIQQMTDLQNMGVAGPVEMADAMADAFPDVAAYTDEIAAPRRLAEKMVDDALDGKYSAPSATCGPELLNYIKQIGTRRMCQVILDGSYPRAAVDLLRKLIRAAQRKEAAPLPEAKRLQPGAMSSPGAIQGAGVPEEQNIARNRYEAASMGIAAPQLPPMPQG